VAHDADRNLLFGVLALQGDLIDAGQFAEACTSWAARKDRPLSDYLVDRGWISAADCQLVEQLLERKLNKHAGDAHKSLIAAAAGSVGVAQAVGTVRGSVEDADVQQSLAELPSTQTEGGTYNFLTTLQHEPENRDRYTLTTLHAKGAIGQVWLARDSQLDREVALKELRPERSGSHAILRRFVQEARITGRLDHPGVVPIYEFSQGQPNAGRGHPYYTMRFIRGRTLAAAIGEYHRKLAEKQTRRTDLLTLIQAFLGVCNTVAFAHSRAVIHRDLKGQNIVLGEFGEVVLLDWGLAKLVDKPDAEADEPDLDPRATVAWPAAGDGDGAGMTAAGQVLGTPAYMAPEQAEGRSQRIGRWTDVYGLGAILYEILAGRPPFGGDSTQDVLRKVREEPPTRPRKICRSAPRALEAVCLKAMSKEPTARYGSAAELATDIQHWLADEPVSAWREPWTMQVRRWVGRNRTTVAAGVAALIVAVAGLSALLGVQSKANRDLRAAIERVEIAEGFASDDSSEAQRAIDTFYSGITEDVILRRPELGQLRKRLLTTALDFYSRRVDKLRGRKEAMGASWDYSSAARGLERVASIQAILGDRESAIQTRCEVVALYDAAPATHPGNAAKALLDLGNLQRLAGHPDDSARSIEESLRRYEHMGDPTVYELDVALVSADLGRLRNDMGQAEEGRRLLERALEIQERRHKPRSDQGWLAGRLGATYMTLGNLHEDEGRIDVAQSYHEKSEAIYRRLFERTQKSDWNRAEWARSLNNLGLMQARAGRINDGRKAVERGQEMREQLLRDQPLNIEYRGDLARSHYHQARIAVLAGDKPAALREIKKTQELYTDIPPKGPEDIYFQACLKAMLADLAGPEDGASESPVNAREREQAAQEAVQLLKQAVAAGYANIHRLKNDPPLAPLQSREDFQELLRSVSAPASRK
jgi:serine/threonine-protein kinase